MGNLWWPSVFLARHGLASIMRAISNRHLLIAQTRPIFDFVGRLGDGDRGRDFAA